MTYIGVLQYVHVKPSIRRLELEVRDGRVECDGRQAVTYGFVYLGALVPLILRRRQRLFQRVFRGVSVVQGHGDAAPGILLLAVRDKELLSPGPVSVVYAQVEDPLVLQLPVDGAGPLRAGDRLRVGGDRVGGESIRGVPVILLPRELSEFTVLAFLAGAKVVVVALVAGVMLAMLVQPSRVAARPPRRDDMGCRRSLEGAVIYKRPRYVWRARPERDLATGSVRERGHVRGAPVCRDGPSLVRAGMCRGETISFLWSLSSDVLGAWELQHDPRRQPPGRARLRAIARRLVLDGPGERSGRSRT